jgi:hypothetical protein
VLAALLVLLCVSVAWAEATPPCSEPGSGWCMARRVSGDVPRGELGFRFGEPLDVDGDGSADVGAGARFALDGTSQIGSAAVWSGADGAVLRRWRGELPDGLFGHWVMPIPDLGGDGLADVVIAAPNARTEDVVHGVLVARSPKEGRELWKRFGDRNENLGWDLALAGDRNGDGATDLFAGAPSGDGGRVYLLSGKDGATLRTYAPAKDEPSFGWFVARTDDLDDDGAPDVAIGAHLEKGSGGENAGAAYVFSSRTGAELRHWKGEGHLTGFGEVVAALGDLDGDGKGEIAVASPGTNDPKRSRPGEVRVYSGATGERLQLWEGRQPGEIFGRMVYATGDLDGDGIEDVAIGAPWHRTDAGDRAGRVELRSGRSGAVLGELTGAGADDWFGWHIRRAPDPEGQGRPALWISSLRHPVGGEAAVGILDLFVLRP